MFSFLCAILSYEFSTLYVPCVKRQIYIYQCLGLDTRICNKDYYMRDVKISLLLVVRIVELDCNIIDAYLNVCADVLAVAACFKEQ